MLTRALAAELAPHIRVNAISPGTVLFPEDFDDAARAEVLARIPMGYAGGVEDIARTVVHLTQTPYITGQVIAVDGGRSAQL
jgi:pteridine reductase